MMNNNLLKVCALLCDAVVLVGGIVFLYWLVDSFFGISGNPANKIETFLSIRSCISYLKQWAKKSKNDIQDIYYYTTRV